MLRRERGGTSSRGARTGHGEVCSWPVVLSQTAVAWGSGSMLGREQRRRRATGLGLGTEKCLVASGAVADCDGTGEQKCSTRDSNGGGEPPGGLQLA